MEKLPDEQGEITRLLLAWTRGDERALEQLAPIVEPQLRRLARSYISHEKPGHTLQPTALVNEAFVNLMGSQAVPWQNRVHFFAFTARSMRRILVNHAVRRQRQKRGGLAVAVTLDDADAVSSERSLDVIALDDALVRFAKLDARKSELVELRFFGGLTEEEAAEVMGVSVRTIQREWSLARAWLFRELAGLTQKPQSGGHT
jgi:RNA polymerase sigma-70 factor, ECF subfamily